MVSSGTRSCLWLWTFVFAFASAPSWGAPIDVTARLDPGQSGPVYSWSLLIRVDPGYDVGAVDILTRGFDSFTPNVANPGIGIADTAYTTNPLGDGRNALILNNLANGIDIVPPGGEALLGTFLGPNRTSPPAVLYDCEVECGGTVFNSFLQPLPGGSFSLTAYPRDLIALHVVPEPALAPALALALVAVGLVERARAAGAISTRRGSPSA